MGLFTKDEPRCGFSRKVVAAVTDTGMAFETFDILSDEEVRQGLKEYSNWPTYPQLYAGGELLGGCDIILEMAAGGELKGALEGAAAAGKNATAARIKSLVSSSPVMLFMKGTKEEPRCGFSRKVVAAVQGTGMEFGTFDILVRGKGEGRGGFASTHHDGTAASHVQTPRAARLPRTCISNATLTLQRLLSRSHNPCACATV